ncbi:MAG: hypothetical protein HYU69_03435 [Bacteroidetes bacterium]|nr:hypothetical protein [Bacteroidota bacterium]
MAVNRKYLILYTSLACLLSISAIAQKNKRSEEPEWKQDTIIGNNVFRKHNNWLSAGGGVAKNSKLANAQFAGGVDYNFHITKEYFQLGLFLSGDEFGNYNNYQFHLCYGKRTESMSINFSYFGGLSTSVLFEYTGSKPKDKPVSDIGLYANVQLIKKIKFDVGIGGSLFADINFHQSIIGAKIDVYFSGAYKGKVE